MTPLAALLLATFGAAAHAETWVSTETKAPRASESVVHVAPMQAGAATHVTVSLKLQNKAELDKLTGDIMAGKARPLSRDQFMSRYAPSDAQVQAVVTHLRNSGFMNITVSDNRMLINADGSAGAIKAAFNTELHTYNVNGRSARGNTSDAQVPSSLSGIVLAVHGLQDIYQHHTMAKPLATTMATTGHNPTDFPVIYGASSLPSATNATIGIITQGSMTQTITDLKSFASNAGYPVPSVSVVQVGSASSDTSGVGEWNMDTQDALAAAGGTIKQMLLYTATTLSDADLTNTYNKAVSDNLAKAINVSLGECENDAKSSGIMASNDQIFQTAVAQGQMFSVSSGDSGAWECGATAGKAQSYPAVSPYVMSIGGTTLSTSGTTWTGETVWSCSSASTCQQSSSGGAGGGPSLTEPAPSWQTSAGVLGTSTKRGVPDISFDAAPSSGALVLINGSNQQIGGTSLAAPIFTGFWARVQSMNGNTLPFPASTLYAKAAANPGMFHDVTSGNQGYAAATGWDYASGYGSLVVSNFATVMAGGSSGGGSGGGTGGTMTERMTNGGFESGTTGWTGTTADIGTFSGETAHSGTKYAWLDGYGTAHNETIAQGVSIPSTSTQATLSFWLHIDTAETSTTTAYDKLTVTLKNSSGTVLKTLGTYSNLNAATGYKQYTFDVSAYAGQTVYVTFNGTEDSSLQTSFVIDDVSLQSN
jgi:pseudomonalisin/xanthomonalisin